MLKKIEVKNFKGFKNIVFDLRSNNHYEFNKNCIKNNIVKEAMIYGDNGSGKSNLGLAIMDLISVLTDKQQKSIKYTPYKNLNTLEKEVEFVYEFVFDDNTITYAYKKTDYHTLLSESLIVNDVDYVNYDYLKQEGYTRLKGTENLKFDVLNQSLSFVKYIYRNTILEDNVENATFQKFMDFVNNMLLFYSLKDNGYLGFINGGEDFEKAILEKNKLKEFEGFLKDNGVDLHLEEIVIDGNKKILCKFDHGEALFFNVISTGTYSLTLFFYWYLKLQDVSFVFIDEFDAFYHYKVAKNIIKLLQQYNHLQFILTTHNTDILSNDILRPDCYFLLNNETIKPLSKCTEKELRKAHNIQKIFKSNGFE